jgi:hypothetical protein
MKRLHDWQPRLAAAFIKRQRVPFAWGAQDCCRFPAACVEAVTGVNPMATLEYADEREALRLIRDGGGLPKMIAARLGPEIAPALAQPGDIGLFMQGDRETMAVNVGPWFSTGLDGLVVIQASAIVRAWRVC